MIQKCLIRREMAEKNFRRKMAVFGGSGGSNLQNQKIRVCYHKTQLLSVITYLSSNYKDKPRAPCVRKCASLAPPPQSIPEGLTE